LIIIDFRVIRLRIFLPEKGRIHEKFPEMGRLEGRGRLMKFDEIKAAVMNLDKGEQRRVVLELLPEIWPNIVGDASCLQLIRKLVDEESVKRYQQEHLDHI
jgi:hypothetical protein